MAVELFEMKQVIDSAQLKVNQLGDSLRLAFKRKKN